VGRQGESNHEACLGILSNHKTEACKKTKLTPSGSCCLDLGDAGTHCQYLEKQAIRSSYKPWCPISSGLWETGLKLRREFECCLEKQSWYLDTDAALD